MSNYNWKGLLRPAWMVLPVHCHGCGKVIQRHSTRLGVSKSIQIEEAFLSDPEFFYHEDCLDPYFEVISLIENQQITIKKIPGTLLP